MNTKLLFVHVYSIYTEQSAQYWNLEGLFFSVYYLG